MNQVSQSIATSLEEVEPALKKAIIEELKNAYRMEMVQSGINHRKIAKFNYNNEARSIDGVGELKMRVDPTHFHYYGAKYGYDCWRDEGFIKDVGKVHPELKVKCGGTKMQFGYSSGGTKRSSQKYNL